jgi:hypothetical protein
MLKKNGNGWNIVGDGDLHDIGVFQKFIMFGWEMSPWKFL